MGLPQELGSLISSNQLHLSLMTMKDLHGNKYDTVIPIISARNLVGAAPIAGWSKLIKSPTQGSTFPGARGHMPLDFAVGP